MISLFLLLGTLAAIAGFILWRENQRETPPNGASRPEGSQPEAPEGPEGPRTLPPVE